MYLPSAALLALLGCGLVWMLERTAWSKLRRERVLLALALGAAVPLGARTALRHRDYKRTNTIWEKTVETRPNNARAWSSLGVVLVARGETAQGERAYRRALELNPNYHEVRINLGNFLLKRGELAAAREQYQRAVELRPDLAEAHYYAGSTALALGEARLGRAHLEQALELRLPAGLQAPCKLELAWALATAREAELRDGVRALELAEAALQKVQSARALDVLAAAQAELGRYEQAAATLEDALALLAGRSGDYSQRLRARLATYRSGRAWQE